MTPFELATVLQVIEKSCQSSMVRALCMDNETDRGLVAEHICGQVEKAFRPEIDLAEQTETATELVEAIAEERKDAFYDEVKAKHPDKFCRCGRPFRQETFYLITEMGIPRRICYTCYYDHSAATHSGEPCVPAER